MGTNCTFILAPSQARAVQSEKVRHPGDRASKKGTQKGEAGPARGGPYRSRPLPLRGRQGGPRPGSQPSARWLGPAAAGGPATALRRCSVTWEYLPAAVQLAQDGAGVLRRPGGSQQGPGGDVRAVVTRGSRAAGSDSHVCSLATSAAGIGAEGIASYR